MAKLIVDSMQEGIFMKEVYLTLGRMHIDIEVFGRHPIFMMVASSGDESDEM